jgi:cyanophycinase
MRIALLAAWLTVAALAPSQALAQNTSAAPAAQSDEQRVLATEDAYVAAEVRRDEAVLRKLVDDKFVYNSSQGTTSGKEELIQSVLKMSMVEQTLRERSVLLEGNIAFSFGTADLRFANPGKQETVSSLRYTAAWVKRDNQWRMLALQMQTRAAPAASANPLAAPKSSGPANGALIVDGGGATEPVVRRFVDLAGGRDARIVVLPTGASSIRFGPQNIIINPDWARDSVQWLQYEAYLKGLFGVDRVTVIHTRDRSKADSPAFVAPLSSATGVFLASGNSGRYADAYLGTRTLRELRALLDRGGVIMGTSAGAIIQGSFLVRGRPDKPLLMAPGRTTGFAFLKNVAINPHLTSAKRDAELINVVDAHPELLGIGIDDDAALVVRKNVFEVVGTGSVAIYDNVKREGSWYYWLRTGERFDLATWSRVQP